MDDGAPTVTIFPLYGAIVPRYPQTAGRAYLSGVGGHLRRTSDGGETWDDELLGEPFRTTVAWFKPDPTAPAIDVGWQAGQYFRIATSVDSGRTWTQSTPERTHPQGAELFDIDFAGNGLHGVMVGSAIPPTSTGQPHEGPRIIWTNDFGETTGWAEPTSIQYVDPSEADFHLTTTLRSVAWAKDAGNSHFWAVGGHGLVLRSTNGGDEWTQLQIGSLPDPHQLQLQGVAASGSNAVVVVGRLGASARAYGWASGSWTQIPIQSSVPGTIRSLTAVSMTGSSMYAVGHREPPAGGRTGVVLKYDPGAQPSGAFVDFPGPFGAEEIPDCSTAGGGAIQGQVLTAVEVLANGDVWIAGTCGRIWQRLAGAQQWVEHKSQTSADIRKMMFLSPTRGYFAALGGGEGTNQVLIRYQAP